MPVTIGVLRETAPGETRVALVPEVAGKFAKLGVRLCMQAGAGLSAQLPDAAYEGVEQLTDPGTVLGKVDVLLKVQPPTQQEIAGLRPGSVVVGFMQPYQQAETISSMQRANLTSFAMELIPRISRAQSMDALSSQAAAAGYKAALIAAATLDKFFPMLTTAAGTIRPARVLVVGAGVAGLQAIATSKRLGAIVEGYDVRSATREQVESLGARFVDTGVSAEGEGGYARELTEEEKHKQQAVLERHLIAADAVVTTAAVPGRRAPRIISQQVVEQMKSGAVIVDLAAETGGNCELTRAGETVEHHGVRIVGPVNLPAQLAQHASVMYSRNLLNFLQGAIRDGELDIDWEDEVFSSSVLTHDGEVRHEPTRAALENSGDKG